MSEPVDIVAEMRGFADALESVAPLVETPANLRRWADHMERLQAENSLLKESIESQVFGLVKPGEPNPPHPEVTETPRRRLKRNAAECHNCHTIIESKHRHDWVQCNCVPPDNGIYVDGGLAYSRRGAGINAIYTDLCEWAEADE